MSHGCQALVVACMDFRLWPKLFQLLATIGLPAGSFDLVSVAGSGKSFLGPFQWNLFRWFKQIIISGFMLLQVGISVKLHGITKVVILFHDDCGAYAIANQAEERQAQLEDLRKIVALIKTKFPALKGVETYTIEGTARGNLTIKPVR